MVQRQVYLFAATHQKECLFAKAAGTAGAAREGAAVYPLFICISLPGAGEEHLLLTLSGSVSKCFLKARVKWETAGNEKRKQFKIFAGRCCLVKEIFNSMPL
jgi:hypothetical protein